MKKGIKIWRDKMGIPHVDAENLTDMYWGNGYVHATDRGMQMLLMRILGQGRASEILDSSDNTLKIDMFFRRMNWAGNVKEQVAELDKEKKQYLESYCEGVNAAFSKKPFKFFLLITNDVFIDARYRMRLRCSSGNKVQEDILTCMLMIFTRQVISLPTLSK